MSNAISLFLLGLFYGTTVCSLTCLPYLGPYLLSTGKGFADGVKSSLLFLSGKLICYVVLGGISGYIGTSMMLDKNIPAKWIMGIAIIVFGLSIPFVTKGQCAKKGQIAGRGISLFLLGISTSLIPCSPLITMFALSANSGSVFLGVSFGLFYGLGLAISPIIIVGGGLAAISKNISIEAMNFVPYMRALSIVMIVFMGVKIIY